MEIKPFSVKKIILTEGSILHILDIEKLNEDLSTLIEKHIVSIHSKGVLGDLESVKIDLINRLKVPKESDDHRLYIGLVAEFFAHLYLNYQGFNQESLYINVEEGGGMKKGFDGYYTIGGEDWLIESKSTLQDSSVIHGQKISEAYKDLEEKVSGKSKAKSGRIRNPWMNALMHARIAGSESNITDRIKKANKEFLAGIYKPMSELNVIPCSTIFLSSAWSPADEKSITDKLNTWIASKEYKKMQIVCVTQGTMDVFWDYLTNKDYEK